MRAKVKTKDPCCRPFFIQGEALLPDWTRVHLWKPTDGWGWTPSEIFPWDVDVAGDGVLVPKFSSEMKIGERHVWVQFFGVN